MEIIFLFFIFKGLLLLLVLIDECQKPRFMHTYNIILCDFFFTYNDVHFILLAHQY